MMEHEHPFSKSRMESLTDGIFATVMTILVLSLVVPIITGSTSEPLVSLMVSLIPSLIVYIFSFAVLLVMWIGHNNLSRYMHNVHPRMLWLNGLLLLLTGVVPLSTAFLGRYPLDQLAILFFGINFFLLTLVFRVFTSYVMKTSDQKDSVLARTSKYNWAGLLLYPCAIALSVITPYLSLAFFALFPIFYIYQAFFGMYRNIK